MFGNLFLLFHCQISVVSAKALTFDDSDEELIGENVEEQIEDASIADSKVGNVAFETNDENVASDSNSAIIVPDSNPGVDASDSNTGNVASEIQASAALDTKVADEAAKTEDILKSESVSVVETKNEDSVAKQSDFDDDLFNGEDDDLDFGIQGDEPAAGPKDDKNFKSPFGDTEDNAEKNLTQDDDSAKSIDEGATDIEPVNADDELKPDTTDTGNSASSITIFSSIVLVALSFLHIYV